MVEKSNNQKTNNRKLKIAILDLTDCEGCQAVLLGLGKGLAQFAEQTEIVNWRLGSDNRNPGPYDIAFIEGSPIAEKDIEIIKQARANSKLVVSLGTCADLGGLQASINWKEELKEVYGKDYKTTSKPPKPISYYIKVDYRLPGCPVNTNELAKFIGAILISRKPTEARYPVCLECKSKENSCLLLEGQACLGPVTKGGCDAACPSYGLHCWGCLGALKGGNQKALKKLFDAKYGSERTEQLLGAFYSEQDEYKALYPYSKEKIDQPKARKIILEKRK